jgi:peptidoglycan/LPS O-acetylase OafA/YrhL
MLPSPPVAVAKWILQEHEPERAAPPERVRTLLVDFCLGYRPILDGIRAVTFFVVMAAHLSLRRYVPSFELILNVFFVLSGFLITALLWQDLRTTGSINLTHFYIRRILRLFPALILVLGVCCLYAALWKSPEKARIIYRSVAAVAAYVGNMDWWTGIDLDLLGHCWTLGLEEQFYVLWPLLLFAMVRLRWRRRSIATVVVLAIAAATLLRAFLWVSDWPVGVQIARTSLPTRADSFLAGCLVGLLATWNCLPRFGRKWSCLQITAWSTAGFLAYTIATLPQGSGALNCVGIAFAAASAALVIAASVCSPPRWVTRVLSGPILTWVGRLSYGLYLWHFPMLTFIPGMVRRFLPGLYDNVLVVELLEVTATFLVASTSYYCIEQPILRMKTKFQ